MSVYKLFKFDKGEYTLNSLSTSNQQELRRIFEGIKTQLERSTAAIRNKYEVLIRGSESKVTNPIGFEIPGSLADARAQAIREYLTINYPTINSNPDVIIKIVTPSLIGNEEYTPGENADVPKFRKDQYVEIKFQQIIRGRGTDACNEELNSGDETISDVPLSNEIWSLDLDFPDDFKTGYYEVRMDSNFYPDAMKITFYDRYYSVSREEWIPLFASSIEATNYNFEELYKAYRNNSSSLLFTYLPIIKAEGIWLNQVTPDIKKISGRKFQLYEYTSSIDPKDAKFRTKNLWQGSTELPFNIQNYDIFPLYNVLDEDLSIYPPEAIRVEMPTGRPYIRKITIPKTENDKSVKLTVYGYLKRTRFDYWTKCIRSTGPR
jgi:hypothetical protein